MCRSEAARKPAGHRKPAPFLMVSATRLVPDTLPDTGKRVLARLSAPLSGCPLEIERPSRVRTHTRTRLRAHMNTHASCNGHPDTFNAGAALRCPALFFEADTAGHPAKVVDTMSEKPMRQAMPTVAQWIDDLREEFGAESIDESIRAGMRGEPNQFHATEGGHEIGTPFEATRRIEPCV